MPEEATVAEREPVSDADVTVPGAPSQHFKNLVKGMEDVLSGKSAATPDDHGDTRPAKQSELQPVPKPGEKPPAEKAPAKAEAPKDDGEKEPFTSPRAADWKKLKAERDEWKQKATDHETAVKTHTERAAAIEKEYTEFKSKAGDPKEIEVLKKEREDYAARLERFALQETPKFRDYYSNKFELAQTRALDAVGKDKADQVKAVLEAPKSSWRKSILNELVSGMDNEVDKLNLIAAVAEYDGVRDERDKQLENHKANIREYKAVEAKKQQEAQERQVANRKAVFTETLKAAEKFESFKASDDPGHNAEVQKNRQLLEAFIMGTGEIPDSLYAMMPILAKEGERLIKVVEAKDAKITELEDALKKYQTAQPQLEGSGAPKGDAAEAKSYIQQVQEQWPGVGARSR